MRRSVLAAAVICVLDVTAGATPHAYTPPCTTDSHVVGRESCGERFGAWASLFALMAGVDLEEVAHRFDAPSHVDGTSSQYGSYALTAQGDRAASSLGTRLRFRLDFGRIYDAFELELQRASSSPMYEAMVGGEQGSAEMSTVFSTRLAIGIRQLWGRFALGEELASGVDLVSYDGGGRSFLDDEFALELRLRGQIWVWPTVRVGVGGSIALLDRHDLSMFVSIGADTRAFGGR
ncbi:MAG TPA: hypothetical protein VLX92_21275 [Kofleriaceae bacterium]|nr:hypothetical protein [Kofleriaceae bacterium]